MREDAISLRSCRTAREKRWCLCGCLFLTFAASSFSILLLRYRLAHHEKHDEEPGTEQRGRQPESQRAIPGEGPRLEEGHQRTGHKQQPRPNVEKADPAREYRLVLVSERMQKPIVRFCSAACVPGI